MNLATAIAVAPFLQDLYDQDVTAFVVNKEKVLLTNINPNLDIGVREGQSMEMYKQSGAYQALTTGSRIIIRVNDLEKFKISYVAIASPLFEEEKVVGAISVIVSTEQYDTLVKFGEELLAAVEEVYATSENLSAQSEELSATAKSMDSETVAVQEDITHVTGITSEIKKISNQSNILGINASIEAARAGENGRGISVVAQEIRKLADETKDSAKNIEEDVRTMQNSITALLESVKQLATVSEAQAMGVTELTEAIRHISNLAEQLVAKGKR